MVTVKELAEFENAVTAFQRHLPQNQLLQIEHAVAEVQKWDSLFQHSAFVDSLVSAANQSQDLWDEMCGWTSQLHVLANQQFDTFEHWGGQIGELYNSFLPKVQAGVEELDRIVSRANHWGNSIASNVVSLHNGFLQTGEILQDFHSHLNHLPVAELVNLVETSALTGKNLLQGLQAFEVTFREAIDAGYQATAYLNSFLSGISRSNLDSFHTMLDWLSAQSPDDFESLSPEDFEVLFTFVPDVAGGTPEIPLDFPREERLLLAVEKLVCLVAQILELLKNPLKEKRTWGFIALCWFMHTFVQGVVTKTAEDCQEWGKQAVLPKSTPPTKSTSHNPPARRKREKPKLFRTGIDETPVYQHRRSRVQIHTLQPGAKVWKLAGKKKWTKIKYEDPNNQMKEGWVRNKHLTPCRED